MTIASGSGRQVAYIAESTYGVTPATPTFKVARITGNALRSTKATVVSSEIRSDRNVPDEQMVGLDVTGGYNFEASYGTLDDLIEAALCGTWSGNVVKNGTTQRSFTFEERLDLNGGNFSFSRFTGVAVNTLSLAINARGLITGSIDCMGQKETLDTAIVTGATYTAANTKPVMSASGSIGSLTLAGGTTAKVMQMSLQINNNMRNRPLVGSLYTDSLGYGKCDVTGSVQIYFEDNMIYQQALSHGGGAMGFLAGVSANEKYLFSMPNCVFLNPERAPGGNTDDVMITLPFRARFDSGLGAEVSVTRAVA